MSHFWGKYRAVVTDNRDETLSGRIKVKCPSVLGLQEVYAIPCVPIAGPGMGFYALPPVNAQVWIEFEAGDPDHPIWTGCLWKAGEAPGLKDKPQVQVWKVGGITLTLDPTDGDGGFTLDVASPTASSPMKFVCDGKGIELSIASQKIVLSDRAVNINDDALEVS